MVGSFLVNDGLPASEKWKSKKSGKFQRPILADRMDIASYSIADSISNRFG